jgi:hypothetical protein
MKTSIVLAVIIFFSCIAITLKVWQCGEMFPNANILACVLWR